LLAECVWAQMLHWLRLQQIDTPSAITPSNEALYKIGLKIWSTWQPWMKPRYSNNFLRFFKSLHTDSELKATRSRPRRRLLKATSHK
jgi:hypothetical protein